MRGAILVSLLVILLMPACSATQPLKPVLTVTISPSSVDVASQRDQNVTVYFNGTVTVDKLPLTRIVVDLYSEVEHGWSSAIDPSSMVFTDEQPQSFTCNASIPRAANQNATLTVHATGNGQGFQVRTSAQAVIIVHGISSSNKTGTNQTIPGGNQSSQGGPFKLGPLDITSMAVIVVVLVVAAASGAYWVRRKRNARRQLVHGAYESPEEAV